LLVATEMKEVRMRHCTTSRKVSGSITRGLLEFFIDLNLPTALWSGVESACKRNEYQEYLLG